MKSRRNILIVLAVLAILSIGIGYAALTDTLTLTGTVKGSELTGEKEAYFDVDWISGEVISQTNGVTATAIVSDTANDKATITISNLQILNQEVKIAFEVKNVVCPAGCQAAITVTDNSSTTNISIQKGFATAKNGTPSGTTTTLAEGASTYFIVIIKSTKTLATSGDAINCTLTYTLTATAVAA